MKDWIQSFAGRAVTPLHLRKQSVSFEDIAQALSNKCRFTGHTSKFYSVASHCVIGSMFAPAGFKLAFLLHELSEVYLPDIATPLKPHVCLYDGRSWSQLEREHLQVCLDALELRHLEVKILSPIVKALDTAMLETERLTLHKPAPAAWGLGVRPLEEAIPVIEEFKRRPCTADVFAGWFTKYILDEEERS